tara:strand:- start:1216 stop:1494 length:279 start_codon:yes stop_codon:yes gene_type:complete
MAIGSVNRLRILCRGDIDLRRITVLGIGLRGEGMHSVSWGYCSEWKFAGGIIAGYKKRDRRYVQTAVALVDVEKGGIVSAVLLYGKLSDYQI